MNSQDIQILLPENKLSYADPDDAVWKRILIEAIERASGRSRLQGLYDEMRVHPIAITELWGKALDKLEIHLQLRSGSLDALPQTGPLVFIANHPFGIIDGLAFCHLVSRVRPRFQIPTNSVLCTIESLNEYLLPVNFLETREAVKTNIETKNRAIETLKNGGAIAIFPGGGISTSKGLTGPAIDLEWKRFTASLIQRTNANVVPLFFHGQNSRLFQIVSQFSLTLRLSLLLFEVRRMMGKKLDVNVGKVIPYNEIAHLKNRQDLIDHLRSVTYSLAG